MISIIDFKVKMTDNREAAAKTMKDITKNVLKKELEYYEKNKKELLKTYKGQFVVIKGDKFIGSYTTEIEAYKAGVEEFGTEPFLIRRVADKEPTFDIPALTTGAINVSL